MSTGCEALIFNIQRFALHDGPGIRTIIFFKGCPLRCRWCSNPEGLEPRQELAYAEGLCERCGRCIELCRHGALRVKDGALVIDRDRCTLCGDCLDQCRGGALQRYGRKYSIDELLEEAVRDRVFFERGGGGITLSGGEPLFQYDAAYELLRRARGEYGLHTAMETSCCIDEKRMRRIAGQLDWILCDIKFRDSDIHRRYTGLPNEEILRNIRMLVRGCSDGRTIVLRLPLVPGLTADQDNLEGIADFVNSLDRRVPLEVLPYHTYSIGKYAGLGRSYPLDETVHPLPGKQLVEETQKFFRCRGIDVVTT